MFAEKNKKKNKKLTHKEHLRLICCVFAQKAEKKPFQNVLSPLLTRSRSSSTEMEVSTRQSSVMPAGKPVPTLLLLKSCQGSTNFLPKSLTTMNFFFPDCSPGTPRTAIAASAASGGSR